MLATAAVLGACGSKKPPAAAPATTTSTAVASTSTTVSPIRVLDSLSDDLAKLLDAAKSDRIVQSTCLQAQHDNENLATLVIPSLTGVTRDDARRATKAVADALGSCASITPLIVGLAKDDVDKVRGDLG